MSRFFTMPHSFPTCEVGLDGDKIYVRFREVGGFKMPDGTEPIPTPWDRPDPGCAYFYKCPSSADAEARFNNIIEGYTAQAPDVHGGSRGSAIIDLLRQNFKFDLTGNPSAASEGFVALEATKSGFRAGMTDAAGNPVVEPYRSVDIAARIGATDEGETTGGWRYQGRYPLPGEQFDMNYFNSLGPVTPGTAPIKKRKSNNSSKPEVITAGEPSGTAGVQPEVPVVEPSEVPAVEPAEVPVQEPEASPEPEDDGLPEGAVKWNNSIKQIFNKETANKIINKSNKFVRSAINSRTSKSQNDDLPF